MLLQQFGLGIVRRPAGPGSMELALTRRVCFRKVSSQPGSLRFLPDRCVRSVRRAEKCAWVRCVRDTPRQGCSPSRSTAGRGSRDSVPRRPGPRARSSCETHKEKSVGTAPASFREDRDSPARAGSCARQRRDLACSGQGGPRGGEPRAARADGADEVPGHRAAGARGAGAGEGRRVYDRRATRHAAEAAGRDRNDPCADRGPRAVAVRPARRGRRGQRLGATAQEADAGRRRADPRPGGRAAPPGHDRRSAANGRSCRSRWSPRSWPTRSSRPSSP